MIALDSIDRRIINGLQDGFSLAERPFLDAAGQLGVSEKNLIARVSHLVSSGVLSRFGPLFNAERLGGAVTLCAMEVPEERFETVAGQVNAHGEVAHNYERDHAFNMWFVIATEHREEIAKVISAIEHETCLQVYDFPKQQEFFLHLKVTV
jgi:DNA-binding Lrp family transcriptional regulator